MISYYKITIKNSTYLIYINYINNFYSIYRFFTAIDKPIIMNLYIIGSKDILGSNIQIKIKIINLFIIITFLLLSYNISANV